MKIKKWFKLFNIVLLIQLIFISAVEVFSQGVAINTTGNAADNSAGLDVQFSDKGILIPRLTISQRNAIINPAEGLLIYNLDCHNFESYNGTFWVPITPIIASVNIMASPGIAVCKGTTVTFTAIPVNGGTSPTYQWKLNGVNVGINSNTYTNSSLNNGDQISCELTSNDACVSCNPTVYDVLTMFVYDTPTVALAGPNQDLCDVTTATLSANTPLIGAGNWSVVSGTATITNPSSPTTSITGLLPGTTVLSWTISNSPCTSSTDDVAIKVYEKPTIADAGLDINLPCGVTTTTLSANTPLVGTGNWSVVSGTATITNPSSPTTSITDLVIPDTVVLRWTISNPPCANSFDDVVITTKACFTCGVDNLTDSRDGNTYQTVQIGTQCWMKENLKYLPSVVGSATGSNTVPYYYVYGYNGTDVFTAKAQPNYSVYGVLYNWPAAMAGAASSNNNPSGVQGVCPSGWHLPSDAEWQQLELYIGMDPSVLNNTGWRGTNEGGKLKETGTLHWTSPNTGATNVSGFTGLGGGFRYNDGTFLSSLTGAGRWWSATEDASYVHGRGLQYDRSTFGRGGDYKEWGFSVRCVKD